MLRSVITAVGHYLPKQVLTNKDLEARMETSDEWIRERTGICQRHIAAEGEFTSDLAAAAALEALKNASLNATQIDALIVATTTPDETLPATATRVQQKIGMIQGFALDMQAACSGFVYALSVADGLIRSGQAARVLVIGAETYSRIVNWDDRGTCILFGDGAGAVVLEAQNQVERGVLHTVLYSDGSQADLLKTNGGVSTTGKAGVLAMNGREVFRHAVTKMGEALQQAAKEAQVAINDIDWLIPHQANARIVTTMAEKFNFPLEKIIMTMDRHANTSAASIPLALAVGVSQGRVKPGQLLAMPALGAGLTWGCSIVRF